MKPELFQIINFSFKSEAKDIGNFSKNLKILRRKPQLDTAYITTKAALTGGLAPLARHEIMLLDSIATLNVYVKPVDDHGNELDEPGWVDDILDQEIIFAIQGKWIDYQNSFYPDAKPQQQQTQEEQPKQDEVTPSAVQETPAAAAPQPTV